MKESFAPSKKNVLVRPATVGDTTPGGIHLPDNAKEKPLRGHVVAAGDESPYSAGDEVIYTRYAGQPVTVNGEDLLVIRSKDVLGLIRRAEDRSMLHD